MDTWHDMGHMSNLSELEQKRGEMGMKAKKAHFPAEYVKEREASTSLYDLRSLVAWFSSGQERKFIYSTRATRGYRKHGISPRIQARSLENQRFRV